MTKSMLILVTTKSMLILVMTKESFGLLSALRASYLLQTEGLPTYYVVKVNVSGPARPGRSDRHALSRSDVTLQWLGYL